MSYIETPLALANGACGLLTRPSASWPLAPAMVLLNAGSLNRSGPFRLHTALARRLATEGVTTLRFDQPGVGEAIAAADRPLHELVSDNLDVLQAATGIERFVLGGVCSAADLAWRVALQDTRVHGLLLLDPLARRSAPGFRLGQMKMVLSRGPRGWWGLLKRRLAGVGANAASNAGIDDSLRDWPQPGEEAAQLTGLVERGVEVFALYTGGAVRYMTHPRQFHSGFGRAASDARVRFAHWPHCDHLFYRPQDRERLMADIESWLSDRLKDAP